MDGEETFVRGVCLYANGREYRFSSEQAAIDAAALLGGDDTVTLSDADAAMFAQINA